MPVIQGYPPRGRSKIRDFEVPAVKGSTPRAYEIHPKPKGSATERGTNTVQKVKMGNIPNRKG